MRERYAELRPDEAALEATLAAGAEKARAIASATLAEVRERDGHRPAASKLRSPMTVAALDLELDVFAGPFDLLLAVVLREEVDLLEVELGEVVVAYVEHLEREGELELEVATEFLVLIASLLELKSRLLLPGADEGLEEMGPEEAIEELLARLLEYRRYSAASAELVERFEAQRGYLYRSAPLPPELRRVAVDAATAVYDPEQLGAALGDLLTPPPEVDVSHIRPTVSLEKRLEALRAALSGKAQRRLRRAVRRRGPAHPGGHPLRPARALPPWRGDLEAEQAARPDRDREEGVVRRGRGAVNDLARTIEALLFLSPQPVSAADLAEATEAKEGQVDGGDRPAARGPRRGQARGRAARGRRRLHPGQRPGQRGRGPAPAGEAADAAADPGAGRDAGDRRLPAAGLPARGGRIRGVSSESAVQTLAERGLIEESGRSRFGAAIFKTTELFERLFGLSGLDQLPDPSRFDPTPEDERELRERLIKAGEQRAEP